LPLGKGFRERSPHTIPYKKAKIAKIIKIKKSCNEYLIINSMAWNK
jgi:hypothetical protein